MTGLEEKRKITAIRELLVFLMLNARVTWLVFLEKRLEKIARIDSWALPWFFPGIGDEAIVE